MVDIQVEKSISVSAFRFAVEPWIPREDFLRGVEVAQSIGIEDAYLLLRRGQGFLTLAQQCHAAFVGVQGILQGHLTGLHGGDDALQFAESAFSANWRASSPPWRPVKCPCRMPWTPTNAAWHCCASVRKP